MNFTIKTTLTITALILSAAIFSSSIASPSANASGDKPKIALYIVNDDLTDGQKRVLTAKFLRPFTESGMFGVIDRSNVFTEQATKERIKQHDGSVNDNEIIRIGYESGARYVLMVDLVSAFGASYNVSARLVDVETAEIFGTQGETDIKNLNQISRAAEIVFYQITGKSDAQKLAVEARRKSARWLSVGVGTGLIPDEVSGMYGGAITGIGGAYISGRYGSTWGETLHTWGIGLTCGAGAGAGAGSGGETRIGVGVNLYPFNDFFLQFSYGTATYSHKTQGGYIDGRYTPSRTVIESGYAFLAGYDFHIQQFTFGPGHIVFSLAGGVTKAEASGWLPAYSAAVGYVFNY
ncbi:MAG: penicillin-binding protein activator LpoB [Chitinispirillales bacterium]|jgi:hypothetical protein|nr:penicillin-binding protein activator LpoB [Chitinispirillales bacterium]